MSRLTKVLSFSVKPKLAKKINDTAKKEQKSKSELLRDMFLAYQERKAETEWQDLYAFGKKTAIKYGIKDEEELFKILNEKSA